MTLLKIVANPTCPICEPKHFHSEFQFHSVLPSSVKSRIFFIHVGKTIANKGKKCPSEFWYLTAPQPTVARKITEFPVHKQANFGCSPALQEWCEHSPASCNRWAQLNTGREERLYRDFRCSTHTYRFSKSLWSSWILADFPPKSKKSHPSPSHFPRQIQMCQYWGN